MVFVVYLVEASPFWDKKRKIQPGGWSANFYDSFVKARVTFNSRDTSSTRDRPKFWQTWTFSDYLMIVSLSETDKFSKTNRQSGWLRRECWLISITWPIDPPSISPQVGVGSSSRVVHRASVLLGVCRDKGQWGREGVLEGRAYNLSWPTPLMHFVKTNHRFFF